MAEFISEISETEGVSFENRSLVRFKPVNFDSKMIALVADTAVSLGYKTRRMPSGAGHAAQMFAANCPTAMIFVPSRDGISHNVAEFTKAEHIRAGAYVLLQVMLNKSLGVCRT